MTIERQFQQAISAAGLPPPDEVIGDGHIHRFSTNGKPRDESGWYVLHLDGVAAGSFGDWRTGLTQTWCSKSPDTLTATERQAHHARIQAMQAARDAEQAQRQQQASEAAEAAMKAATPAPESHPYLAKKCIKPHGILVDKAGFLLIPMRDSDRKLWNVERINPADSKDKRGLPGGRRTGLYFGLGKPDGVLIVAEGFATGASLHECTEHAVAVAFNAGNLKAVATALRGKYPALKLIIAADDDVETPGNPGLTKATEAAQAVGGFLAMPDFGADRPDGATDFNDLHQIAGAGAVKACVDAARIELDRAIGQRTFPALPNDAVAMQNKPAKPQREVMLINGCDLNPEPVRWLWPGWLALGKLHILAGGPGQGKTTIALAMAATVTIGGRWPDGSRCAPGNVLVWSGEDDPADTLLPRLIASGADRSRVYFVGSTRTGEDVQSFDPATDLPGLQAQAEVIGGVRLIIVDPIVSAVTGDSHKNTEVRRALQPVVDLASRMDAAAIGITHFSKGGQGNDPASRVVGSVAFTAVARVVLVAAKTKDEDGNERRILARGKSNIGPDDGGFEYHIEHGEPLPGIHASYATWGKAVAGSARELLAEPEPEGSASDTSDAVSLLRDELTADCWTAAKLAQSALSTQGGFSKKQIWSATQKLGVVRRRGGFGGDWYWRLPGGVDPDLPIDSKKRPIDSIGSTFKNTESMEPMGVGMESMGAAVPDDVEEF